MAWVRVVSRCRAGMARLVTATWSRIQTEESRVNSRFGSGSMMNASGSINWYTRPPPLRSS